MCGIYGVIGKTSTGQVIEKLKSLEYRGYDSCGMAYDYNNQVFLDKTVGNTDRLRKLVPYRNIECGIGHTRWATHGSVTPINAHPHTSVCRRFYLVHNGVLENYRELIRQYQLVCQSDTDTEVIVQLLDLLMKKYSKVTDLFKELIGLLKGSFAIAFIDKENPQTIYFYKNKSPLLIGKLGSKFEISSDQNVFEEGTNVMILNDGDYGFIGPKGLVLLPLLQKHQSFIKASAPVCCKKTDHYMLDEIYYQKEMIQTIEQAYRSIDVREFQVLCNQCDEIVFVGAGSSYYAGLYLKKCYERLLDKRCSAVIASEIESFSIVKDALFVLISQSGETADLIRALSHLKNKKQKTIALCNQIHSSIGYACDLVFPLFAGTEVAVASTKAFMAMILVGKLLIAGDEIGLFSVKKRYIEKVLEKENEIRQLAKAVSKAEKVFFLGKGLYYPIALEGALKLREISYLSAFAFYSGELKHGSIALVDQTTVCIGLLHTLEHENFIKSNLEETRSRGALTYLISNVDETADLILPDAEVSFTVFVQLLAYYTALELNRNIDQPRNLAKSVTVY